MIEISKEVAELIREKLNGVHIRNTKNKIYVEERKIVMNFFKELEEGEFN